MAKHAAPCLPLHKAAIKLDMADDAALEAVGKIKVTIRATTGDKMYHMSKIQQGGKTWFEPLPPEPNF